MKFPILVGTHHKTGTHWMKGVFQQFAGTLDIPLVHLSKHSADAVQAKIENVVEQQQKAVLFHDHSHFPPAALSDQVRGVRMIRDPRDVTLSALSYHRKTESSWVHKPQSRFDGRTLVSVLADLPDDETRLRYEFSHVLLKNFGEMRNFPAHPSMKTVKYEQFMTDSSLSFCIELGAFLGLEVYETVILGISFWQNSLFGGYTGAGNPHVTDGSVAQYRRKFSDQLVEEFESQHAALLDELGYSDGWSRRRHSAGTTRGRAQIANRTSDNSLLQRGKPGRDAARC